MKYLLMHCVDESREFSADERAQDEKILTSWLDEMHGRGVLIDGERLRGVSDATTVRVRDSDLLVTDGPFAETKEQICGYDVIECANLDEAIEVASKHPVAMFGTVEVRPFWPLLLGSSSSE